MTRATDEDDDSEDTAPFRFAYDPGVLRYGSGCVDALGADLAALGCERALVVCGRTVGETAAVIDPIRDGLGSRFAGLFAETTPQKRLSTAVEGANRLEADDADAIVAVGGGSSLDVARVIATVAAGTTTPAALADELEATGSIPVPDDPPPILVVPTTFAGADLSQGGGITAHPEGGLADDYVEGGVWDQALLPAAAFYDPSLFATTPRAVLAASAMNGFDKGIETLYSRNRTAITDATATRGLSRFAEGLLSFDGDHEAGLPAAVEGLLLVQYGISRADGHTLSVIHALAKHVARSAGIQQGVAHAIVAPATLEYVFEQVDGRRRLMAEALPSAETTTPADEDPSTGADEDPSTAADDPATAAIDAVTAVRDVLGVPTRLRDLEGLARADFESIAQATLDHSFMDNAPPALDPTAADLVGVLDASW